MTKTNSNDRQYHVAFEPPVDSRAAAAAIGSITRPLNAWRGKVSFRLQSLGVPGSSAVGSQRLVQRQADLEL
jgi:hypothetical protein